MDTVSESEKSEDLADKPNSIVDIWKRLWPLIISVGLFVLLNIISQEPIVYDNNDCPNLNWNAFNIGLAANGVIATLIINRLTAGLQVKRRWEEWFQYIVGVPPVFVAIFFTSLLLNTRVTGVFNTRIIGVVGFIVITIVILVGRERKRPTRSQALVWLASLLLLIITQYLAWSINDGRICTTFGSPLGPDV